MFRVNAYSTISSPQYLLCLQDPVKKALTLRKAMKDMLQQEAEFKVNWTVWFYTSELIVWQWFHISIVKHWFYVRILWKCNQTWFHQVDKRLLEYQIHSKTTRSCIVAFSLNCDLKQATISSLQFQIYLNVPVAMCFLCYHCLHWMNNSVTNPDSFSWGLISISFLLCFFLFILVYSFVPGKIWTVLPSVWRICVWFHRHVWRWNGSYSCFMWESKSK